MYGGKDEDGHLKKVRAFLREAGVGFHGVNDDFFLTKVLNGNAEVFEHFNTEQTLISIPKSNCKRLMQVKTYNDPRDLKTDVLIKTNTIFQSREKLWTSKKKNKMG
jgi:hypothetical protein